MPAPLKHLYTEELIASVARALNEVDASFNVREFQANVFCESWQQKELKERMRHVAMMLHQFLPNDYQQAIDILTVVVPHFQGFEYMFFPDYVELYGLNDFDISVEALECFTLFSSSEFAVRPFIKKYGNTMMAQMEIWAASENEHVRRLASEGCRPRLPWAMALPEFKKDPTNVLKVLEILKGDDSEYVRRSVANNLNDISKDHAEAVINVAKTWIGQNADTDKLVKHACRTLLKQGHSEVLELFGFVSPDEIRVEDLQVQESVSMGEQLGFLFTLKTEAKSLEKLRIEYAIDFMKKNGKQARKVFKISESLNANQTKEVSKEYSFKKISTRKYYPGKHGLAVIINGVELASDFFDLKE
ncbi:MAG: DNA alkylation repair protein [Mariprofundaceae bacterium]